MPLPVFMFKYFSMSPTGAQNNCTETKPNFLRASVFNALATYSGALSVPRLPTGSLYSSSSLTLFVVIPYRVAGALRAAYRYARPGGLLT